MIKNSSQVGIEFKPWTENHLFRVTRLQLSEQLEGEAPRGEIDMFYEGSDKAMSLITEQNTGTIDIITEKDIGHSYKGIDIYITERKFFGNFLYIKFLVTKDIKFFTERITTYYPKDMPLYKKIQATFPGPSGGISPTDRIRIDYDVPDILLYQNNETNYEFNKRLCLSYKKDSIFAYGWEGLLIKDLMGVADHLGNTEPDEQLKLESNRLTLHSDTYNLKYNKRTNHEPYNPWSAPNDSTTKTDFSSMESKYLRTVMNYGEYKITGIFENINTEPYLQNAWHNRRLLHNGGYTYFEVNLTDIPNFKLGDVIIYNQRAEQHTSDSKKEKIPWKHYLVTSNELFYTIDATRSTNKDDFKFAWTTRLMGLEDGDWNKRTDP